MYEERGQIFVARRDIWHWSDARKHDTDRSTGPRRSVVQTVQYSTVQNP